MKTGRIKITNRTVTFLLPEKHFQAFLAGEPAPDSLTKIYYITEEMTATNGRVLTHVYWRDRDAMGKKLSDNTLYLLQYTAAKYTELIQSKGLPESTYIVVKVYSYTDKVYFIIRFLDEAGTLIYHWHVEIEPGLFTPATMRKFIDIIIDIEKTTGLPNGNEVDDQLFIATNPSGNGKLRIAESKLLKPDDDESLHAKQEDTGTTATPSNTSAATALPATPVATAANAVTSANVDDDKRFHSIQEEPVVSPPPKKQRAPIVNARRSNGSIWTVEYQPLKVYDGWPIPEKITDLAHFYALEREIKMMQANEDNLPPPAMTYYKRVSAMVAKWN